MAVGIDIPPLSARGKGYGESALSLYMAYLFIHHHQNSLYTETWSGNTGMIRLAEKIGFREAQRIQNTHEVRGNRYDALTFSITKESFYQNYPTLRDIACRDVL